MICEVIHSFSQLTAVLRSKNVFILSFLFWLRIEFYSMFEMQYEFHLKLLYIFPVLGSSILYIDCETCFFLIFLANNFVVLEPTS